MADDNSFGLDDFDGRGTGAGSSAPVVGIGVVRIGKRDYAVGLHWAPIEAQVTADKDARAAALNLKAEYYCLRPGAFPQYGLGFKAAGHKANMPSLAAHLSASKQGAWIGLFAVAGGYYLIAVKDGAIDAETDRYFENSQDALDALEIIQANWGSGDWEIIAPASLSIYGSKEIPISQLIDGRPSVRLREVSQTGTIIRLGAIVAGLIGLAGFYFILGEQQMEMIEAELAAKQEQAREILAPEQEIVVPPMPWEGKPLATAALAACVREVGEFPLDIPGWSVKEIICVEETIAAAIDRDGLLGERGGPVTWIAPFVTSERRKPSVDFPPDGSGSRARVQWSLGSLPRIPVDLATLNLSTVRRGMLQVMEQRMTPVTFGQADSNEFWRGMTFSFKTKASPLEFGDLLAAIPGVIINKARLDVTSGEWLLEGSVYEQLPLPKNAKR